LSKQRYKQNFLSAESAIEGGLNFAQKGQLEKAIAAFTTAIKLDPSRWEAYRFTGIAYAKLKRYKLALKNFNVFIQHSPNCADCFFERGTTKVLSGQPENALKDFSKCLNIDRNHAPAYSSRAGILTQKGLYQKALIDIKTALIIKPQNPDYLHNRALILTALGRYKEAIEDYTCVIKLNPRSGGSYNNLAWLLSTAVDPVYRDCRKAIMLARKSLQIDKNVSWMDTLATAYAECGEFEKAVSVETDAYKLSVPPNENFHKRIMIYKSGKTFTEWIMEKTRTPRPSV
jgi:Flp pilus assembly protein TadD